MIHNADKHKISIVKKIMMWPQLIIKHNVPFYLHILQSICLKCTGCKRNDNLVFMSEVPLEFVIFYLPVDVPGTIWLCPADYAIVPFRINITKIKRSQKSFFYSILMCVSFITQQTSLNFWSNQADSNLRKYISLFSKSHGFLNKTCPMNNCI